MSFLTRWRLLRGPFRHRQLSIPNPSAETPGEAAAPSQSNPRLTCSIARANLATRDFLSLLQDLLSDEAIGALKKGK
jgi:hypothetical protein